MFKKGDREDPGNCRGITLLSVVDNQCLDKGGALHEGQAGFRVNKSCMDNVYTLICKAGLGGIKKHMLDFSYDTVWRDGFWLKL